MAFTGEEFAPPPAASPEPVTRPAPPPKAASRSGYEEAANDAPRAGFDGAPGVPAPKTSQYSSVLDATEPLYTSPFTPRDAVPLVCAMSDTYSMCPPLPSPRSARRVRRA